MMTISAQAPSFEAYDKIKTGILALRYRPGEKLSEDALLGSSIWAARQFEPLWSDLKKRVGFRVHPQSGTFVRDLSRREAMDLAELRLLLEAHAAERAAERISAADLNPLRAELRFSRRRALTAISMSSSAWTTVSTRRCIGLRAISGSRRSFETFATKFIGFASRMRSSLGASRKSLKEMDRVLDALERRDGAAAATAMRQHIGNIAHSFASIAPDKEQDHE